MARLQSQVEVVAGEAGRLKDVTLHEATAPSKKRPRRCAHSPPPMRCVRTRGSRTWAAASVRADLTRAALGRRLSTRLSSHNSAPVLSFHLRDDAHGAAPVDALDVLQVMEGVDGGMSFLHSQGADR